MGYYKQNKQQTNKQNNKQTTNKNKTKQTKQTNFNDIYIYTKGTVYLSSQIAKANRGGATRSPWLNR